MRFIKALAAAVAIAALAVAPPWLLIGFVGHPWPENLAWSAQLSVSQLVALASLVMWALWAQTLWCLVAEVIALARSGPPRRARAPLAFAFQQQAARVLIGAVAAAFITVGSPPLTASAHQAGGAPSTTATHSTSDADAKDGGSLQSMVAHHLDEGGYVVQEGDTIWQVSADHLGDPYRWPEVHQLSADLDQPVGDKITDPDLILPGQILQFPDVADPEPRAEDLTTEPEPDPSIVQPLPEELPSDLEDEALEGDTAAEDDPAAEAEAPSQEPDTAIAPDADQRGDEISGSAHDTERDLVSSAWLYAALTGAGIVLAGALWFALKVRRARQHRHRQPGRVIAAPPADLMPAERSIHTMGPPGGALLDELDDTLRRLAASHAARTQPLPNLFAAEVSATAFILHLSTPAEAPEPWHSEPGRSTWHLERDTPAGRRGPDPSDQTPPWPMLASIGHDSEQRVWLLNLESGITAITGDETSSASLIRHVAAGAILSPWASQTQVELIGLGEELQAIAPDRLTWHPGGDAASETLAVARHTLDRLAGSHLGAATARAHQHDPDPWPSHLAIADAPPNDEHLAELADLIARNPGRTGTAMIVRGAESRAAIKLDIDADSNLTVPGIDRTLRAVSLSRSEAAGCTRLLAQAEALDDVPAPDLAGEQDWKKFATVTGAVRSEHRHERTEAVDHTSASLLKEADEEYLAAAATTANDLDALAPRITAETRQRVADLDPDLDADVTAWFDDSTPRPRLTLLGPVGVRTSGKALDKRKPFYVELAAFLATRPHGAVVEEVAEAFGLTPSRVRIDVNKLRGWLGASPETGKPYLPDARNAPAARARGLGVYQITDALVDLDLFRRLRLRGETRGTDGMDDLRTALRLVTGRPFDRLRPGGWAWLAAGDRVDLHMVSAIVDVAHVVVTHALYENDLDMAHWAANLALDAAPDEETPRLDLAQVCEARGEHHRAQALLDSEVFNRGEDGPEDLPERTAAIIAERGWADKRAM